MQVTPLHHMVTHKHFHVPGHCKLLLLKAALQCYINTNVLSAHCLQVLCLAHFLGQDDEYVS